MTEQEHAVLQPFLRCPALGERALIDGSGSERAARILAQLRERYGGLFAPYITCPRNRGEGGFKVKIVGTDGAKNAAAHPLRT